MKGSFKFMRQSALLASSVSLFTGFFPAEAGLMDILKGEQSAPAPQRVAFLGSANVREVAGRAERLIGIDQWQPLQPGAKLEPGDVIRTSEGTVILRMQESRSFVKVTPNTQLRLVPAQEDLDLSAVFGVEERDGFVVRSCRGEAYTREGGKWRLLAVNDVLTRGSDLRTGPGSVVDLFDTALKQPVRVPASSRVTLGKQLAAQTRVSPNLGAMQLVAP